MGLTTHLCVRPMDTLNRLRSRAGSISPAARMCVMVKNRNHDALKGLAV